MELFGLDESGAVWRYARDKDLWIRMSMKYEHEFGGSGGHPPGCSPIRTSDRCMKR